ncbi:hypothetical protein B0H19DRAFT_1376690 [Mycena capillaripes]|nr:hypothetical protein B0H19DRAFT_1376690 [Mycena capillaripes]
MPTKMYRIPVEEYLRIYNSPDTPPIPSHCHNDKCKKNESASQKLLRCSLCRAVQYCSQKCQTDDWKGIGQKKIVGINPHKRELCPWFKRAMEQWPHVDAIQKLFPWSASVKCPREMAWIPNQIELLLGLKGEDTAKGYWREPACDNAIHDSSAPERVWSQDYICHGSTFLQPALPSHVEAWTLPSAQIPHLAFDDAELKSRMPALHDNDVVQIGPLTTRGGSSTAMLGVVDTSQSATKSRRSLNIHFVGAEKELNVIPLFSELALLIPNTDITMTFFGPACKRLCDLAAQYPESLANNSTVFEYIAPAPPGGSTLRVKISGRADLYDLKSYDAQPDAIISENSGLFAYISWQSTYTYAAMWGVPWGTTEYNMTEVLEYEEHMVQWRDIAIENVVRFGAGHAHLKAEVAERVAKISRVQARGAGPNPFMRPGLQENDTLAPRAYNGFVLHRKASDPEILSKWRREALGQQKSLRRDKRMTEKMVDYVLAELTGYANIADNQRGIERGCFDAIWYSDRMISDDVTERLKVAASALENVPEPEKDWHPVLDLVHPSLYCLVYDRTHAYARDKPRVPGNLLPVTVPTSKDMVGWSISPEFCWLPSDFSVGMDGSVNLLPPYINNLNPSKHQGLYRIIEEILSGFIPMFDRVLGDIDTQNPLYERSRRIENEWSCIWPDEEQHSVPDFQKILPQASTYTGELEKTVSLFSLRGRTIQCIIKLANIRLTPECPEYAGGSWHIEGMANEHIIASGIYYYDEENITTTDLAFRVDTTEPHYHGRNNDHDCTFTRYGMSTYGSFSFDTILDLYIGHKSGSSAFMAQHIPHCVSAFRLSDLSKPGHRKILAIFLVDPTIQPIPSTTNVPPQQVDWACEALKGLLEDHRSLVSRLPQELVDSIKEQLLAMTMTLKEAEAYRLELMKERTVFVKNHSDTAYGVKFNMYEH